MDGCIVGWLDSSKVGFLKGGWVDDWLVIDWMDGFLYGWMVGFLNDWVAGCLDSWMTVWLDSCMIRRMVSVWLDS